MTQYGHHWMSRVLQWCSIPATVLGGLIQLLWFYNILNTVILFIYLRLIFHCLWSRFTSQNGFKTWVLSLETWGRSWLKFAVQWANVFYLPSPPPQSWQRKNKSTNIVREELVNFWVRTRIPTQHSDEIKVKVLKTHNYGLGQKSEGGIRWSRRPSRNFPSSWKTFLTAHANPLCMIKK